jgi:peptidyl-prolyl cis-trans isomerase B (cyclophilin B)
MTMKQLLVILLCAASPSLAPHRAAGAQPAATPQQAVVETSLGTFVLDITPQSAPNHAAYFIKQAQAGAYDGTAFHRMVRNGMVMGGDPISKDPAKAAQYGTGGLNAVKAEPRAPKMLAGMVAAVLAPNHPDSAGAQFFIVLVDQPALDNQYSVFAKVAEGMDVLVKISETPVDSGGKAAARVDIRKVTIRDTPPPEPEPFVSETVEELSQYRAILETSAGPITLEFLTDKAPEHVRQFLKLARAGVYDGMAFHRVAPGFVIQTGSLTTRAKALTARQQALVHNMTPEFNDTKHVKGIVSLARGDAPDSGTTSFFICTGPSPALDGVYTAFARVVDGMAAVEKIEAAPRTGETPNERIDLTGVRLEKR